MSISTIQNFYKETITRAVTLAGATNIYVSALPTPDEGYVVISPSSSSLREIVYYTAKGTDGNGSYLTVTADNRGLSGTTAQTHVIGEPVRMNVTAEHIKEISDALDQIVAAGAQDASTITKGIVKLSSAPAVATSPVALNSEEVAETGASKVPRIKATGLLDSMIVPFPASIESGYALSDNVLHSNDGAVDTASSNFEKVKEIQVNNYINTLRVVFTVSAPGGGASGYGRLYLNGVPIGGEVHNSTSTTDITTVLVPGDLLQVYARRTASNGVMITNFRLCGTLANKRIYILGGNHLVSPLEINSISTQVFSATNNL